MARLVKLQEMNIVISPPSPPRPASIAYPPIYLSPSSFSDAFAPAPSPVLSAHHSSLSKAAIIGGAVAGVITLAVAATVIGTVASNMGLSCLLTPALNVLSSLSSKLNSCSKFCPQWNSKKEGAGDAPEDGGSKDLDYDQLLALAGNNPTLASVEKAGSAAAAAESIETAASLQKVVGDDLIGVSTKLSKYAASELKKHNPIINEVVRARDYGQTFLSSSIDDFAAAATELKKQQSLPIISTSAISKYADTEFNKQEFMINELAIVGAANQMSNYAASELKQQAGSVINEEVRANEPKTTGLMSRYAATESKKQDFASGEQLVKTISVREMSGMDERNIESSSGSGVDNGAGKSKALVAATGGKEGLGPIIPSGRPIVEEKALANRSMWHATTTRDDRAAGGAPSSMEHLSLTEDRSATSRHRTNLGQVSLSCDISAFQLRCFGFCNSGGTYGSSSYVMSRSSSTNNYNHNYYSSNNHSGPRYNQPELRMYNRG